MQDGSESENYIVEDFIVEPEDEEGENVIKNNFMIRLRIFSTR